MTQYTHTASHIADYYPFGMEIQRGGTFNPTPPAGNLLNNRYLYNSKEFQDDFGLNWGACPAQCGNYGARFYDAQIARFHSIDPLTEKNHRNTPYSYAANNPIRYIDWLGLDSLDAAALTQAAQNAVAWVIETYGSITAQCNRGVNHAFEELTGSTDLAGKNANEMINYMESSDDFVSINRDAAQEEFNDGAVVIAGEKSDSGSGHVTIGVPGVEESSGNWGGSAPVGMDTGSGKRWASKGMNHSFTTPTGVTFYKYIGVSTGTINNQIYAGGTLPAVTVAASGPLSLTPRPAVIEPQKK